MKRVSTEQYRAELKLTEYSLSLLRDRPGLDDDALRVCEGEALASLDLPLVGFARTILVPGKSGLEGLLGGELPENIVPSSPRPGAVPLAIAAFAVAVRSINNSLHFLAPGHLPSHAEMTSKQLSASLIAARAADLSDICIA